VISQEIQACVLCNEKAFVQKGVAALNKAMFSAYQDSIKEIHDVQGSLV
jgi:hypothetical protein